MKLSTLTILTLSVAAASCGNRAQKHTTEASMAKGKTPAAIRFEDVPSSPDFPGATLSVAGVTGTPSGKDSSKVSFSFIVGGFDLKAQTGDAAKKMCNNSDKGQHIHFILDNRPYVALYEPKHETTVARNSEHYALCFLSRSYHESVKTKGAAVLVHFRVDATGNISVLGAGPDPILFYSRPKGDYLGKDTTNVLLDFYVWNGTLSKNMKVQADVENITTGVMGSYTFTDWKPKFVKGLGTGTARVTLRLLDRNGRPVPGPQSTVTREGIRLAGAEPMQ
jgi:hypothetical protein